MVKEIGGYFELELKKIGSFPHSDGVCVNSGRNALEYILRTLPLIKHIWIPYFTCNVILEPLKKLQIPYSFYRVNNSLEIDENIELNAGDYILATNYFGVKDEYIKQIAKIYKDKLIVDNAQSFFSPHILGINTIYSPRKFVGVPDGGIAYTNNNSKLLEIPCSHSYDKCSHLLKRIDLGASEGYVDFKNNSKSLSEQPVLKMSELTKRLLYSIDFEFVKKRRLENFTFLHTYLREKNLFDIPSLDSFECPMVYPYLTNDTNIRKRLIENKVFVAKYWPNVLEWCNEDSLEYRLTESILPIPIDQRYNEQDMDRIIKLVLNGSDGII